MVLVVSYSRTNISASAPFASGTTRNTDCNSHTTYWLSPLIDGRVLAPVTRVPFASALRHVIDGELMSLRKIAVAPLLSAFPASRSGAFD